jgi:hypothetical protein
MNHQTRHLAPCGQTAVLQRRFGWVPNGPSEQLRRRPAVREGFRTAPDRARSTASSQEWHNSWASAGGSPSGETVAQRCLGGGRGTRVKHSLAKNQWLINHTSCGGCCLENTEAATAVSNRSRRCAACNAVFDRDLEQGGNTNIVVRRDLATTRMRLVLSPTAGAACTASAEHRDGEALRDQDASALPPQLSCSALLGRPRRGRCRPCSRARN